MERWLYLIPLLPLVGFLINIFFGRSVTRGKAHWVALPLVFVSVLLSLQVLRQIAATGEPITQHLYDWIPSGDFLSTATLRVDQLSAIMLVVVSSVGFLVHLYSVGYMHGDPGYARFFSYLSLFVFSMLMLVLSDNFLMMFVFWEAVGLCSYLLIGFWFRRRAAANAATKAFIVNRIGDVGFGLAIMWTFFTFGTINFQEVFAKVPQIDQGTLTGISLLFFLGAVGKSAQFPLHVWLPDAMEGPTPVSALIHAATMVTAGIYLVARANPIYQAAPTALGVVAIIGAFTAFMAATIAICQNDIKRIVAYSTLSQLGYMCFALGVGAWIPSIFHLTTHAFFKALLFLGAGSVIHGMHEEQDIQRMGGLRKLMPITFVTFLFGSLANAGVVPFSGYWSKDEILLGAFVSQYQPLGKIVWAVGLITAFLTGLYMFRLIFLVFFGKPRYDERAVHPHESPWSMTVPLIALAIPSLLIGVIGWPPEEGPLHHFLAPVFQHEVVVAGAEGAADASHATTATATATEGAAAPAAEVAAEHEIPTATKWAIAISSTVAALGGILVAYLAYYFRALDPVAIAARYPGTYAFLLNKWGWDDLYQRRVINPFKAFATFLWRVVDEGIIDGTVNGVASGIGAISQRLRHVQTGLVTNYALAIALGMVLLVGIYLGLFSSLFR